MKLEHVLKLRKETPNVLSPDVEGWRSGKRALFVADQKVRSVVQNLIDTTDEHKRLRSAKVLVVMRIGKALKANTRTDLGKAGRVSPLVAMLAKGADFVMELNGLAWNAMTPHKQCALLDHKLCHCTQQIAGMFAAEVRLNKARAELGQKFIEICDQTEDNKGRKLIRYWKYDADGRPVWTIRKHDVEEFVSVTRRWGPWTTDLADLVDVLEKDDPQGQLFDQSAKAGKGKVPAQKAKTKSRRRKPPPSQKG